MAQTKYLYTDDQFYHSLIEMRTANNGWPVVKKGLEHSLAKLHESMEREQGELQVRWKQGACQFIREFLESVEEAHNRVK